jgi:two-component system, LuxR family, response regulator FixJ
MHRSATLHDLPTVFVVDPDPATDAMVKYLLDGSNIRCEAFSTCREFLAAHDESRTGCLVLEQHITDMSGYQLLCRLATSGVRIPLVFAIGQAKVSTAVELMRRGAVHVLEKPLRSIELLNAIQEALDLDQAHRSRAEGDSQIRELVTGLSRKDREVLDLIAQGRSIKSMAAQLELSARAVEQRKHRLMAKLQIGSPLDLMRFSVAAQRLDDSLALVRVGA